MLREDMLAARLAQASPQERLLWPIPPLPWAPPDTAVIVSGTLRNLFADPQDKKCTIHRSDR